MSKIVQAAKTVGKELDKGAKKLDEQASKAIGMEEGNKISHTLNVDSPHHKEAVKDLKGTTDTKPEEETRLAGEDSGHHTDEG